MSIREQERREVAGLTVVEWPGSGPAVLCLPGLTSTSAVWGHLADALPDRRVVSIDLRGRGGSQHAAGPTGLHAHATDVAVVARELDLQDVVLVGHSMGAFLAPLVAAQIPDRISRLVLLDGGIPPGLPRVMGPAVIRRVFRRQLKATVRDWPNVDAMAKKAEIDLVVEGREQLRPLVLDMLGADLVRTQSGLRPPLDVERCVADAVDAFTGHGVRSAITHVTHPVDVLLADHGKHARARAFISDKAVATIRASVPQMTVQRFAANHITILFVPEVATAVSAP